MVAKAAWLTVEPEISLEAFLASEETDFFPKAISWLPEDWSVCVPEHDETCASDDAL
jgi:hypothetical protein